MADGFQLKVYTPAGGVLSETVQSVTLQNADGEIGILPGHTRYISLLGTGILKYTTTSGTSAQIVASEGFCHFADGVLTVMADQVDLPSDAAAINLSQAKDTLQREMQSANFFEPEWDIKATELKRLEALERLRSH